MNVGLRDEVGNGEHLLRKNYSALSPRLIGADNEQNGVKNMIWREEESIAILTYAISIIKIESFNKNNIFYPF